MVSNHFVLWLSLRLLLLLASLLALAYALVIPGYHATSLVLLGVALLQVAGIARFVRFTNTELTRFLEACRYADFGQSFGYAGKGLGFSELGRAFDEVLARFRTTLSQREADARQLRALVEHVPVPLLSLQADNRVVLHNHSARRLFGAEQITQLEDLAAFGAEFKQAIARARPGERRLVSFTSEQTEKKLALATTQLMLEGKVEQLISLQDIQGELDIAQLQAWQDLVRVLTHEIMNSITPVASLAKTSLDLVDNLMDQRPGDPRLEGELRDIREAVHTMVTRSDGLARFIHSYRRLARLPPPSRQRLRLDELIASVVQLATVDWERQGIALELVLDASHEIQADRQMVEQVLLNLLQNAEQALAGREDAKVRITTRRNRLNSVVVEVADNGPGIAPELQSKVFMPFFTTKIDGSGVGLALTRQIMIAHGGSVALVETSGGGASFVLTF